MKSVIQESSTLGKAIEQAWEKAGRPTEFTAKVLQHPKRGFLGLTAQAAKVVIFFDEKAIADTQERPIQKNQPHQGQHQSLHKDGGQRHNQQAQNSKPQPSQPRTPKPQRNPNQQKTATANPAPQQAKQENTAKKPTQQKPIMHIRPLNTQKPKEILEHINDDQSTTTQVTTNKGKPNRHRRWKKNNPKYKNDEQHKKEMPTHGDRQNQRSVPNKD